MKTVTALIGLLCVLQACVVYCQLTIPQIIQGEGYPVETHTVTTADGYILKLHRIPHGRGSNTTTKGVVFFQHGLFDASFGAIANAPPEGLGYFLADNGFDVWMGNNRGNGISMQHVKYTPKDEAFWDFSWDDMAQYDLPANLEYVTKVTGQEKVAYIGHSQGTVQAFSGFLNATTASKVSVFIALAPVAYVNHVTPKIMRALADIDAGVIISVLGFKEISIPDLIHKLFPDVCKDDPSLCADLFVALAGDYTFKNESRLEFYVDYEPYPTSVKNLIHWSQGVKHDVFQKYDYGYIENMKHYGQATPPSYKPEDLPKDLPIALFTGSLDALADPTDVAKLISELPVKPFVLNQADYGHLDFTLGYNANVRVYPTVVERINAAMS